MLAALVSRGISGKGAHVQTSLLEAWSICSSKC